LSLHGRFGGGAREKISTYLPIIFLTEWCDAHSYIRKGRLQSVPLTADFQVGFPQFLNYIQYLIYSFYPLLSDDSVTLIDRLSENIRTMAATSNW
jgi:hypothetical protein